MNTLTIQFLFDINNKQNKLRNLHYQITNTEQNKQPTNCQFIRNAEQCQCHQLCNYCIETENERQHVSFK